MYFNYKVIKSTLILTDMSHTKLKALVAIFQQKYLSRSHFKILYQVQNSVKNNFLHYIFYF